MGGAIISHLTILGVEHNNDGGTLFICAAVTFVVSAILLIYNKKDIPFIGSYGL